ncbi:MAG TPA: bifunctional nuclease family protein [Anaerolineales bacterium]|nr:bifunctional nuclease family protein [Anaerolineales bacterium]
MTDTNYVEVVIDSIRVSLMSQQRIVILREKDADRYLPIWIGPYEAEAITIALQGTETSRPLTHDLLLSVFRTLNARLVRVEVNSLRDQVYYGNIVAELNGETIDVDSRPSDALAIAVRARIPILVEEDVMEDAGIIPEESLESDVVLSRREREQLETTEDEDPAAEERLSVFEDFLEGLDFGSGDDEEDDGDDDDDDAPDIDGP